LVGELKKGYCGASPVVGFVLRKARATPSAGQGSGRGRSCRVPQVRLVTKMAG
jgi:hypothetical protein